MTPSDVCPTEDAVQAFLEHLVDPLLPGKSSGGDNPTLSQQQSVAKQVCSVVLLYNYYHRKQHPELAYLPFNEFCKLSVVQRPTLLPYMQKLNQTELIDVDKQLSLTEKMIMDACDVCKCLDASKNVPNIEGWPVSKVAVFLVNSKKECCFLLFGAITRGVWSVVEKGLETSSQSPEVASGTKNIYKNKRVIRKPTKDELNVDESRFLQVGYAAVKEATGINNTDITFLGSYTVYSQSKEKAAARFYIMQCSQLINQEVIQVPIKDVIESLRGPLVEKSSNIWVTTPVVDYFHVLPYSEIISEWFSREAFSNSLQHSTVTQKSMMVDRPEIIESYVGEDTFIGLDGKPSSDNIKSLKQKENNRSCTLRLSDFVKDHCNMEMDKSSVFESPNKEKNQFIANTLPVGEDQEKNNPFMQYYSNGSRSVVEQLHTSADLSAEDACADQNKTNYCYQPPTANPLSINLHQAEKFDTMSIIIPLDGTNNPASGCKSRGKRPNTSSEKDTADNCTLVANHSNSDPEKLKVLLKGKLLSQTALSALIRKRNELTLQQRVLEDEIAICDKKIHRLLTDGNDDIALKIESIIEGCNDTWVRNQERMVEHQSLPPSPKRKKLTEAVLIMPCQELDTVCRENSWVLPTYRMVHKNGEFLAHVSVKGPEFESTCEGEMLSDPRKAKDSAAARMLAMLRGMAKSAQ